MNTQVKYMNILQHFKQEHGSEYGITRIGVFGSVARNEHTEDSDVDVLVEHGSTTTAAHDHINVLTRIRLTLDSVEPRAIRDLYTANLSHIATMTRLVDDRVAVYLANLPPEESPQEESPPVETPAPVETPSPANTVDDDGLSLGVIIGIIAGVIVLAGIVFFVMKKK